MSALILLSLPLSLVILASLASVAVLDVALRATSGTVKTGAQGDSPLAAPLPAIEMLRTASYLTGEIPIRETRFTCSEAGFVPEVTEIEARAIAGEISRRGIEEVERIVRRSQSHNGLCPMRLTDGQCACSLVRPLDCLGRCVAGGDSPEWAGGLGHSVSAAFRQHLHRHHADATTHRLDDALLEILDETHCTHATVC